MGKFHLKLYIILGLYFCFTPTVKSQTSYTGEIQYKDVSIFKQEDKLLIRFNVDLSSLQMSKQLLLSHVPVLQSADLSKEYTFDPILVSGTIRNKVIERQSNYYLPDEDPLLYVVHKNQQNQLYPIELTLPYEEWMRDAKLTCKESVSGCAKCGCEGNDLVIVDRILPPVHVPSFEFQYITPEAEPIKHRSETYSAHLNFKVARHELIRDFENNAAIFAEVDKKVTDIKNDKNLTVQSMEVIGYASPEGDFKFNLELSKKRTYSFVNYLVNTHKIEASIIKVNWKGEDWDGLIESLKPSTLFDRDEVVRIIEKNENISVRKQQLKSLNRGETYNILLNTYYPPLRRIEYTFSYVARAFDIEEAKEVIKTKPQHLSLNEMYLVANTYSKGSEEFNQIFDIAVRLFPEDAVANSNAAVQEIEMGAIDKGIERLKKINSSEAFNNQGIAYFKKGDFVQAKICFEKAIQEGNIIAEENMKELELFLESK